MAETGTGAGIHPADRRQLASHLYLLVITTGLAAAWLFYFGIGVGTATYPGNTFLCDPSARFRDFTDMVAAARSLNPYHTPPGSIYPPLANLFYFLFSQIPGDWSLAAFLVIPAAALAVFAWRWTIGFGAGTRLGLVVFGSLSTEPFLFAMDRANLELWVLPLCLFFVEGFRKRDPRWSEISCVSLAVAIALKLHPVLFLILYLRERRWLEAVKVAVYAAGLTLGSAALLHGGLNASLADFWHAFGGLNSSSDVQLLHARFNTGLFDAVWLPGYLTGATWIDLWSLVYPWVAASIGVLAVARILRPQIAFAEAYASLAAIACLLPALANDYRMIQLLPPAFLLLRAKRFGASRIALLVLIALVMVPKNQWLFGVAEEPRDIGSSSVLNPALLLAILAFSLVQNPTKEIS